MSVWLLPVNCFIAYLLCRVTQYVNKVPRDCVRVNTDTSTTVFRTLYIFTTCIICLFLLVWTQLNITLSRVLVNTKTPLVHWIQHFLLSRMITAVSSSSVGRKRFDTHPSENIYFCTMPVVRLTSYEGGCCTFFFSMSHRRNVWNYRGLLFLQKELHLVT